MLVSRGPSIAQDRFQRFFFPNCGVVFEILTDLRREDEESAIHPLPIALRLLSERQKAAVFCDAQRTEFACWLHGREAHQLSMTAMKCNQRIYIDIRHPVSIGHAKHLFIFYVGQDPAKPSPGHSR